MLNFEILLLFDAWTFMKQTNSDIIEIRGGVQSNQTNFELIFLEFFELKMNFQINRIKKFSNRTNWIILPSNRILNWETKQFLNFLNCFPIFEFDWIELITNFSNWPIIEYFDYVLYATYQNMTENFSLKALVMLSQRFLDWLWFHSW